ncbi:MAG: hypothetical protein M3460_16605 [Actinomycetota bacterium]|nr:hypothetical protein [Actinomycetota bacterium]
MSRPPPEPHVPGNEPDLQIVQERPIRAFEFLQRRIPIRAHTALVFLTAKGDYQVISPQERPTTGELFWKRIRRLYEVDLGQHLSSFEADVPSGNMLPFHAEVDLQWSVSEPHEVVRRGIATSQALVDAIRPDLLEQIRQIAREFNVFASEKAESKINSQINTSVGASLGLRMRPYVRLSVEQSTINHASEVLGLRRKTEIEQLTYDLRRLEETNRHELLSRRVSLYRDIIAAGDIDQFAIQISSENNLNAVIEAVRGARDTERRNVIDFFTHLSESGLIERYEMDDRVRAILDWLNESITRVIGNSDDHSTSTTRCRRRSRRPTSMPSAALRGETPTADQDVPQDETESSPSGGGATSGAG